MANKTLVRIERRSVGQIWLITFCDMMTNLMLFFLVMFALTRVEAEKRKEILAGFSNKFDQKVVNELKVKQVLQKFQEENTVDNLKSLVENKELQQFTNVEVSESQVKITLKTPVLFALGRADLNERLKPALAEVADLLRSLPNTAIVEGHTDNQPISSGGKYDSNWGLSVARAYSIIQYFVQERGLPAERFVVAGYGEFRPLYPNDTEEHRALNRRIEINILRKL